MYCKLYNVHIPVVRPAPQFCINMKYKDVGDVGNISLNWKISKLSSIAFHSFLPLLFPSYIDLPIFPFPCSPHFTVLPSCFPVHSLSLYFSFLLLPSSLILPCFSISLNVPSFPSPFPVSPLPHLFSCSFSLSPCAADFSLLNLPKGKSLGRSKPATNS